MQDRELYIIYKENGRYCIISDKPLPLSIEISEQNIYKTEVDEINGILPEDRDLTVICDNDLIFEIKKNIFNPESTVVGSQDCFLIPAKAIIEEYTFKELQELYIKEVEMREEEIDKIFSIRDYFDKSIRGETAIGYYMTKAFKEKLLKTAPYCNPYSLVNRTIPSNGVTFENISDLLPILELYPGILICSRLVINSMQLPENEYHPIPNVLFRKYLLEGRVVDFKISSMFISTSFTFTDLSLHSITAIIRMFPSLQLQLKWYLKFFADELGCDLDMKKLLFLFDSPKNSEFFREIYL